MYYDAIYERAPEDLKQAYDDCKESLKMKNEEFNNLLEVPSKKEEAFELGKDAVAYAIKAGEILKVMEARYRDLCKKDISNAMQDVTKTLDSIKREDLEPYLKRGDLDARVHPEKKKRTYKELVICFLQDSIKVPYNLVLDSFDNDVAKGEERKKGFIGVVEEILSKKANDLTGIINLSDVPAVVISDKDYRYSLTSYAGDENEAAYLTYSPSIERDEDGNTHITEAKKPEVKELLEAGYNEGLFGVIMGMTLRSFVSYDKTQETITVNISEFCKAIGADYRKPKEEPRERSSEAITKHKGTDITKLLENNEKFYGVIPGESQHFAMLKILSYDLQNDFFTFTSPYCTRLIKILEMNNSARGDEYQKSYAYVVKPSISTARNKRTVAALLYLVSGLTARGCTPDCKLEQNKAKTYKAADKDKITYSITLQSLILEVPIIYNEICKEGMTPKRRTDLLRRIFLGNIKGKDQREEGFLLIEYIKEYTLLYDKYVDLEIKKFDYSYSKIAESKIVITHRGINPEFENPYLKSDK